MDIKKEKKAMRAEARARRAEARACQKDAGARACRHFLDRVSFGGQKVVAGYLPVGDEFDVLPLLEAAVEFGLPVALPFVSGKGEPLIFRSWSPGEPLTEGALGIPVPPETAAILIPSLLFVPMLAFDKAGYRLGYGGGFYDRSLSLLRAKQPGTLAVGVAFAAQRVDAVPCNNLDEPLDWIVTEEGARAFDRS